MQSNPHALTHLFTLSVTQSHTQECIHLLAESSLTHSLTHRSKSVREQSSLHARRHEPSGDLEGERKREREGRIE